MLCVSRYAHSKSNWGPITIGDNRVHGSGKVHGWKTCTNQWELLPKTLKCKQKNRRSTVAGVHASFGKLPFRPKKVSERVES